MLTFAHPSAEVEQQGALPGAHRTPDSPRSTSSAGAGPIIGCTGHRRCSTCCASEQAMEAQVHSSGTPYLHALEVELHPGTVGGQRRESSRVCGRQTGAVPESQSQRPGSGAVSAAQQGGAGVERQDADTRLVEDRSRRMHRTASALAGRILLRSPRWLAVPGCGGRPGGDEKALSRAREPGGIRPATVRLAEAAANGE